MTLPALALFPSPAMLVDFFSRRVPQSVVSASALLGWPEQTVRRRAAGESLLWRGQRIPWEDVAFWLFETWQREWIVRALGPHVSLLPALTLPTRVQWHIPAYVLLALQHEAACQSPQWSVDDYVAQQLHLVIGEETVRSLAADEAFVRAYHFPHGA